LRKSHRLLRINPGFPTNDTMGILQLNLCHSSTQIVIKNLIITTESSYLNFQNYEIFVSFYHLLFQFEDDRRVSGRITRAAFRERVSTIAQSLPRAARLSRHLYNADRTT
jgi:hypothetical protein